MNTKSFPNDIPGFGGFIRRNVARFPMIVELVAAAIAIADPSTPIFAKGILCAAVAYVLSPFDAVPDFIPVAGWLDDIAILAAALKGVAGTCIKDEHRQKARRFLGLE